MYAPDHAALATPIGLVRIRGDAHALHEVTITADGEAIDGTTPLLRAAVEQLRAYFAGIRTDFDLPIAPLISPRGMALRAAMQAIPYGETATYGQTAAAVGSSARAVGGACRRNPFPIVVPCHRVTSASGPEHYSAGTGPDTKAWLLAHERKHRISS